MALDKALEKINQLDVVLTFVQNCQVDSYQKDRVLEMLPKIRVYWDSKRVSRLGVYHRRNFSIGLSKHISKERDVVIDTLMHETAHFLDHILFNGNGHGRSWKYIMRGLGRKPDRCGDSKGLTEARKQKANHVYACQDCGHKWYAIRRWKRDGEGRYHPECRIKENKGEIKKVPHIEKMSRLGVKI